MIKRVDQGKRRGAVKGTAVIEGGRDTDRGLVGIRYAEINLSHVCLMEGAAVEQEEMREVLGG